MTKKINLIALIALTSFLILLSAVNAKPSGATANPQANSTYTPDDPQSHNAVAGNVTEINFNGVSVTQSWQGYFGNVTGSIVLGNADKEVMYNWSILTPSGEVYASTNSSLLWTGLKCFNLTANVSSLESTFNIPSNAADGVDETFNRTDHALFYTNNQPLQNCSSTKLYNNDGTPTYDVVLISDAADNVIFASILRQSTIGFDGESRQFQMIVLEDGHNGNIATTPYYFYLELN